LHPILSHFLITPFFLLNYVGGTYGDRGNKFPLNNNALNVTEKSNDIHGDNQISDQSSNASDVNQNNINFKPVVDPRNTSESINFLTEDGTCESMTNKYSRFTSKLCRSDTSECSSPSSFEKWKKEYSNNSLLRQIMASSLGTCVSVLTLNPMSVVKLRLQRQDIFMETTVQGAFRTIYKKDGIRGFWAGEKAVDGTLY
jgi:Mitochondrial carrier protein